MKSSTIHVEGDPVVILRSFIDDNDAREHVAKLASLDPEDILTYATVVITQEGHVRVISPDPHDNCVQSILVDGMQVMIACQQIRG